MNYTFQLQLLYFRIEFELSLQIRSKIIISNMHKGLARGLIVGNPMHLHSSLLCCTFICVFYFILLLGTFCSHELQYLDTFFLWTINYDIWPHQTIILWHFSPFCQLKRRSTEREYLFSIFAPTFGGYKCHFSDLKWGQKWKKKFVDH